MKATDPLNVIHARAAGVDVHKMQLTATVRLAQPGDQAETFTRVFSALPSGIRDLVDWLLSHDVAAAAMEATGIYWETVYDTLAAVGVKPVLLHARHVKQIKGRKTDIADSMWLARICQFGLCTPSLVLPPAFRELRQVSRLRRQIVGERSRARNRIHKILDRAGIRAGGILSDLFGFNGRQILRGLVVGLTREEILASLSCHVRRHLKTLYDALSRGLTRRQHFLLQDHLEAMDTAEGRIAEYDAVIAAGLADYRTQVDLLTTMPGVDVYSASAMLIELGPDISVFPSARHCAAWAGLCPGNNESAGKRRAARSRKGNAALRAILTECALGAARTHHCQFRGYHKTLTIRRGYKRATVATAHKMLRIAYQMLRTGRPYHDPETDYEALMVKRNAPRWIRMLEQHGFMLPSAQHPATA